MATNPPSGIRTIAVIGSGLMGAGIVQVAAQAGLHVAMVDLSPTRLDKGTALITASLHRVARKRHPGSDSAQTAYVRTVLAHVSATTDTCAAVRNADLVVEAVVENLPAKRALFADLDGAAPPHAILASNTSSLPIADIAAATGRPDRVAGLHFFNPVPQMKLVEIVRTSHTSPETVGRLKSLCSDLGKTAVVCRDTPGFIVNRLLVPYMMEALRLVERGEASKEDVDTAMKLGAGYPMGPFELMDYVGLDTLKFICDGWYESGKGLAGDDRVSPPNALNELVKNGHLGRKCGKGFYDYTSKV
ncbi:hypothetical protein SeLEV6574_g07030 [Synchytrium endobioticum]|uniref:3-hydroxyacyl-CoA dehydrogenase n=1 Tax=Synchytrium endobioticum TaxID=286115 RepID=A0A507CDX6_9FUNG|nr:hypothetical protein SeLEV6574_g07030 [Synchytrium endobioticum]